QGSGTGRGGRKAIRAGNRTRKTKLSVCLKCGTRLSAPLARHTRWSVIRNSLSKFKLVWDFSVVLAPESRNLGRKMDRERSSRERSNSWGQSQAKYRNPLTSHTSRFDVTH